MGSGSHKLCELETQRTLHTHTFSKLSTQASFVLTDLLSHYLTLLTFTCAKCAQHAHRTKLNVQDAISTLDELGVNLEELRDYCATEGRELNPYHCGGLKFYVSSNVCVSSKCQFTCLISYSPTIRRLVTGS